MENLPDPIAADELTEPAWEKVNNERKRVTVQKTEAVSTKWGSGTVSGTASVLYMHPKYLGSVEK